MNKRRGGDESVGFIASVWDMPEGAACGDGVVDRQDAAGKFRMDVIVEAGARRKSSATCSKLAMRTLSPSQSNVRRLWPLAAMEPA